MSTNAIFIHRMLPFHWEAVKNIYIQGIASKNATFQTEAPEWDDWDKSHPQNLRFVGQIENVITGWGAFSPVSSRIVYSGVMEVSIYVHKDFRGKGIGNALLGRLVTESELQGIWTLQAGIFPENHSSIALHEKFGFRKVGYREKIGKMDGIWRDTILMERRSQVTGQV